MQQNQTTNAARDAGQIISNGISTFRVIGESARKLTVEQVLTSDHSKPLGATRKIWKSQIGAGPAIVGAPNYFVRL